jgi:lactate dehydrogenase-like 2-hydroxyacid dehydrogenase
MKIAFFGLGSIGKRHAKLIKENYNFEILAYRSNINSEENDLGIKETNRLEELLNWNP